MDITGMSESQVSGDQIITPGSASAEVAIPGSASMKVTTSASAESTSPFSTWSDEQVLHQCILFGEQARRWRNRFLGILPEVAKRRLYEREGCSSVVEFAKKVGGVSEDQVRKILHVEEELRDTPALHELLVSGQVSISKMAKIHTVATPDNEEFLANQIQLLSKSAVETLARDMRQAEIIISGSARTSSADASPQISNRSTQLSFGPGPESAPENNLKLSEEVQGRLLELQRRGIDISNLLTELLDKREQEIVEEKEKIAHELATQEKPQTRYIPTTVQKVLQKEHGTKCSRMGCTKLAKEIHHEKRWGVDPTNDPHYLAPLCEEHHEIAHAIDVKVQEKRRAR